MAINPIAFARTVNEQFLRYQLTILISARCPAGKYRGL